LLLAGVPWLLLAAGVAAEIWWQTGHHSPPTRGKTPLRRCR
jgi:hypothetical protein